MEEKKSSSSWTAQGMFRSARARVYSRSRGPGERMSTTMSSHRQGRRVLVSSSVTGYPSSSRAAIRSAANRASAMGRERGGPSVPRWMGRSSRWNSAGQSVRSGR